MAKDTKTPATLLAQDIENNIVSAQLEIMGEAMLLDSTQRGAVLAGVSAARLALRKIIEGLSGQYVARKRLAKPTEG